LMFPAPSVRHIFDRDALSRMPVSEGMLGEVQVIHETPRWQLSFVPTESGPLQLWARPDKARAYVIGATQRPGRASAPGWAVACVLDQRSGAQVAQIRQQLPAPRFAEQLAWTGKLYNWAFLLPEAGDLTGAVVRAEYPPERIFPGVRAPGTTTLPWVSAAGSIGIELNAATWPKLVESLASAIRQLSITLRSAVARDECLNFVIKPNAMPGPETETGSDACVWAAALAAFGLETAPRETPYVRQLKPLGIGEKAPTRKRRNPYYDE
jgi:hypothetical protein